MIDATTYTVLGGRYELHRSLGDDGAVEDYLAHDRVAGRPVVVSMLHPHAAEPSLVARLRSEVEATTRLSHPSVVSITDWGTDDGDLVLVREHVEGTTLAGMLWTDGVLPAEPAARIGAEVAAVLTFAHRNGIAHGSLDTTSIVITPEGDVKVAGFGVALHADDDGHVPRSTDPRITGPVALGLSQTVEVDPRPDLQSLGLVLREMVGADRPLDPDPEMPGIASAFLSDPVAKSAAGGVPAQLASVIDGLLTTDPAWSYPSAEAVEADLRRVREGLRQRSEVVPDPIGRSPGDELVAPMPETTSPRKMHDQRATGPATEWDPDDISASPLFLVTLACLLVLVLGSFVLLYRVFSGGAQDRAADAVDVPTVLGDTPEVALDRLLAAGLLVDQLFVEHDEFEAGTVFAQDPPPRAEVEVGTEVTISIAQAPRIVVVPDVLDKTRIEASEELAALGFVVDVQREASDVVENDHVIEQSRGAGDEVDQGAAITLVVSTGPEQASIPDLAGVAVAAANLELGQAGFQAVRVEYEPSAQFAMDEVVRTDPPAGSHIELTALITVFVSTADNDLVPAVVGLGRDDAERVLDAHGFDAGIEYVEVAVDSAQDGLVVSQRPGADALAPLGSQITLQVACEAGEGSRFLFFGRDKGCSESRDHDDD